MKHIRQIALFFLAIFSIQQLMAAQDTQKEINAQEVAYIEEQATEIDNQLHEAYQFLSSIDRMIEQLALLTSKHQFKNITNAPFVINIFRDLRTIVQAVLRDQASLSVLQQYSIEEQLALKAQITVMVLEISNELITYLDKAIKTNLHNLKPFDLEVLTKRSPIAELSFEMVYEKTQKTRKKLDQLKKNVDHAGLTWYNRAARHVESLIVKPCVKWNIPHIATIGALTGSLAWYIAWKQDKLPANLTPAFAGTPVKYDVTGHVLEAGTGAIGSLDQILHDWVDPKHLPYLALFGGIALRGYQEAWKTNLYPYLRKQLSLSWNFLRGGAYEHNTVHGVFDFTPDHNFDDLIGLDEVKQAFLPLIHFLDNPEQYLRVNAAPEAGYILTGPTRTGKTYSVECLCGEVMRMLKKRGRDGDAEFKFWKIDAALINQFGIKDILATAKDHAPVILFIDEIDLLGLQRVGNNQLLSQFLVSMGNTLDKDPSKQVILIGATNRPETMDSALRQYGRLGKEIRFEYPSFAYRKEFITRELLNMALTITEFDVDTLVQKTDGKSFEELRAIIRGALIRSWMHGNQMNQALLEECIDTELHKIIMIDRKELSSAEKYVLAAHFAGRALAMTLLDTQAKLDKVTIKAIMPSLREELLWEQYGTDDRNKQAKIEYGALLVRYLSDNIKLASPKQMINEIKILLAGFMAEEILLGTCTYKCHPKSSTLAYAIIENLVFEGLDSKKLAKNVREKLEAKAYNLFEQYKKEVKELLLERRDILESIAHELQEKGILNDKQIYAIVEKPKADILVDTPKETEAIAIAA